MDKETREFLEKMQIEMQSGFNRLETRLGKVETRLGKVEVEKVKLELSNEEKYLELQETINQMKKDLLTVEKVASSNYLFIAELKNAK
jgi:hypothetical protein